MPRYIVTWQASAVYTSEVEAASEEEAISELASHENDDTYDYSTARTVMSIEEDE